MAEAHRWNPCQYPLLVGQVEHERIEVVERRYWRGKGCGSPGWPGFFGRSG